MARKIPEELEVFIRDVVSKSDLELVDIITRGGNSFFMEIIVDSDRGATLDECTLVNKKVSNWVEENNVLSGNYTVDVCSPGLDRALKSDSDYAWAIGKCVKAHFYAETLGKKEISGVLKKANDNGEIEIESADDTVTIDRKNISKCKVVIDKFLTKKK